ncbi:hypothetical protein [Bradyrhizobium guangxiense]|uniref:hypothetical protein n=1 Tax=Bradyrhizobium guangxiense TaxID=1325115 RepID=UPI0010090C5E|nr:hypothetical protein [Bradyrhizobium guangxiense]
MSLIDELSLRFMRHNNTRAAERLRSHFLSSIDVLDKIEAKRAEARADKRLSDHGRADLVRSHAPSLAPHLVRAKSAVALARREIKAQRDAMTPRVTDRKDTASAMLRLDLRQFLRGKTQAEIARIAEQDRSVLEAVFEGPAALSGLTDEVREHILTAHLNRTAAPQMQDLAEQESVVEVLETAIAVASNAVADAAGVMRDHVDAWLVEQAPAEAKAAAEALGTPPKPAASNSIDDTYARLLAEGRAEIAAIMAR